MGEPSIRKLKSAITYREFIEWQAYYNVEPFGEQRSDLRAGIVAAAVANSARSKGRAFKASDFMPKFGRDGRPSEEVIANRMLMYFRAMQIQSERRKRGNESRKA